MDSEISEGLVPLNESGRRVAVGKVFAFVWRYWRRMPGSFGAIMCGIAISVALEVTIPTYAADLVVTVQEYMGGNTTSEIAWQAMWWLIGIFTLRAVINHLYLRVWMYVASTTMHRLVTDGFSRVQRFSADWHTNHFAGSTQRMITRGMWAYDSFADTVVVDLGPACVLLVGFALSMYLRDPALGLYFIVTVSIFLLVSILLSLRYVAPANRASNSADTTLGGALADAITCNMVVKSFGSELVEDERLINTSHHWRTRARTAWLRSMNSGGIQSVLLVFMLAGMLWIVMEQARQPGAQVDDVVFVITTYFIVNSYLRNIGWQIRNLQRSINELDDLVLIEETMPQVRNRPGAATFIPHNGRIEFNDVEFGYTNQSENVYQRLTVTISPGEKIALVGESGAGKSTFVKLLQRIYDLNDGEIIIDGQNIAEVTQESLRANISLVPQDPILFHRSLYENIAYAKPGASLDEVMQAAKQAHAHEFIARLDDGYDTLVGERGIKLSGGERQRVAIARAILADASILVLDEATSSLDSVTELQIQDAISTLMEGRTSIVVAHRLSTIRAADRILVFAAGAIVEEGTHQALMSEPDGIYRRFFDIQSAGFKEDPNLVPAAS